MRFSFIFFLLLSLNSYSQDCNISLRGKVLDNDTKENISGVVIQVIDSDIFTVTDEVGNFVIDNLCESEISIKVSSLGYSDSIFSINNLNPTIYLNQESLELNSVLIIDEREKNRGTQTIYQQSINIDEKGVDRTLSIANIASQIDGVTFISTGSNVERPVIHGLYGNRILVLNNYLKHGFQNWGDDHAPEINVSSVDRISVIKGSSGVRFGPEALGGG